MHMTFLSDIDTSTSSTHAEISIFLVHVLGVLCWVDQLKAPQFSSFIYLILSTLYTLPKHGCCSLVTRNSRLIVASSTTLFSIQHRSVLFTSLHRDPVFGYMPVTS